MGNLMLASVAGLFFSGLFYLVSLFLFILSRLNFIGLGKLFGYVMNLSFYFAIAFAVLFVLDLVTYGKKKARREHYILNNTRKKKFVVGLLAYNEEPSIAQVVTEFKSHPLVSKVIVVDNNSKDKTSELATKAGADIVVLETRPGYDSACLRVLKECLEHCGTNEVIALCEADGTFSSLDLDKFLAYLANSDMAVGSRMCPEIVDKKTQLEPAFYSYGNYFIAKLIHLKYYLRLTDVGCTYRAINQDALRRLLPHLKHRGHAFSPHMITEAAKQGLIVVEIPVTFKKRIGISKGAGGNYWLGWKTGWKMIFDIIKA